MRERGHAAFTLIELLVVITLIAILVGLLTPAVQMALTRGKMTQTLSNGSQIYKVLYAHEMNAETVLPRTSGTNTYVNSTDFFRDLVRNEVIDVDFSFFSASGLTAYRGVRSTQFRPDNNAWCITADISASTRNQTPMLFTRNLLIRALNQNVEHVNAVSEDDPFGTRGVVLVTRGGGGSILKVPLVYESFNPHGARNRVLRP